MRTIFDVLVVIAHPENQPSSYAASALEAGRSKNKLRTVPVLYYSLHLAPLRFDQCQPTSCALKSGDFWTINVLLMALSHNVKKSLWRFATKLTKRRNGTIF